MNTLIKSIEAEYRRYKALAEAAIEQVPEDRLSSAGPGAGNSLAILCWHMSGNLKSRFTDFLESDGEKPWRERDEEFVARTVTRSELTNKWEGGWDVLFTNLAKLDDHDLSKTVQIRGQDLKVHEALHRSLAHLSYHVGQVVYIAHSFRGDGWRYLSIPPGESAAYNSAPDRDKAASHASAANRRASNV